jgi:hypothetical protein
MASSTKHQSVAQRVRKRVLGSRERMWRVEDFEDLEAAGGSSSAVNNELRRLVARGDLARVRRGVYWRGQRSRFGSSRASATDTLRISVGGREAVGATGWHAANLLGLSTQVSPVETLAVTHRQPAGLSKVKVSTRAARSARRDAKLTGLEVTFLEALEGWERYVEADSKTALKRFRAVLDSDGLRVKQLVAASRTEPPAVRERLRAVLEHSGEHEAAQHVRRARDPRTRERALRVIRGGAGRRGSASSLSA